MFFFGKRKPSLGEEIFSFHFFVQVLLFLIYDFYVFGMDVGNRSKEFSFSFSPFPFSLFANGLALTEESKKKGLSEQFFYA